MLEAVGLSASYGAIRAVDEVSLRVGQGEIVSLIGPNGAGKSTLLAAVMGLMPSTGTVRWLGRDATALTVERKVADGLVLVPETRELFADLPVADNLLLGGFTRYRRQRAQVRQDLDRVYALFPRLRERAAQLAGTLSGGERQMLAIGRAIMARPRLLMLDEPSLGLAPLIVKQIFESIEALAREERVSVLLVEQNARAALRMSSYGYVLETGRIASEAPAESLMQDPRVLHAYLGGGPLPEDGDGEPAQGRVQAA